MEGGYKSGELGEGAVGGTRKEGMMGVGGYRGKGGRRFGGGVGADGREEGHRGGAVGGVQGVLEICDSTLVTELMYQTTEVTSHSSSVGSGDITGAPAAHCHWCMAGGWRHGT